MKLSTIAGGAAAALIALNGAQAGTMEVVYWGVDASPTIQVDGRDYDLGGNDGWVTVKPIDAGSHTLTLTENGASRSWNFTLSSDNVATGGGDPPNWCLSVDDGVSIVAGDDCGAMIDAWMAAKGYYDGPDPSQ